jgi:hypothetical protein
MRADEGRERGKNGPEEVSKKDDLQKRLFSFFCLGKIYAFANYYGS